MNYGTGTATYIGALRDLGAPRKAADKIAAAYPGGFGLATATPRILAACVGIETGKKTPAWIPRIGAAYKLAASETTTGRASDAPRVRTPHDVVAVVRQAIGSEPQECFLVLYLDARQAIIDTIVVHRGRLSSVEVEPYVVLRPAIQAGAHSMILAHNHPSGNPGPSEADIELTRRLVESASLMGVQVLDHLIVTPGSYSSFQTLGLI